MSVPYETGGECAAYGTNTSTRRKRESVKSWYAAWSRGSLVARFRHLFCAAKLPRAIPRASISNRDTVLMGRVTP